MSEVNETPVAATAAPAEAPAPAPTQAAAAPKPNAIQLIEAELGGFLRQREQAIANVHAIEGAIQAAQHLLARLRAEVAKAEEEAKKLVGEAATAVEEAAGKVVEITKKA